MIQKFGTHKRVQPSKVIFTPAPVDMDADLMSDFLGTDWARYILRQHPRLKTAAAEKDAVTRKKLVMEYLTKAQRNNLIRQKAACKRFSISWKKGGEAALRQVAEIIGADWPEEPRVIVAFVSMNPICPRFLESWSFSIGINYRRASTVRRIVAHEVSHFLHFRRLFGSQSNIDRSTFEAPHSRWLASELAVVPLLNDPRVQQFIGEKEKPYPEHRKIRIDSQSLPSIVHKQYRHYVTKNHDYPAFIKMITAYSV
jgi:hypothetical protein